MTLISPAYCTYLDIERYLSHTGAEAFATMDSFEGEPAEGVYDDVVNQATEEINMYLLPRYTGANLATSTLVNRWATTFGAYFLTLRRGNPPPNSLAVDFERIKTTLEKIACGQMALPGIALRGDRPTHDNLVIDRRYYQGKVRVQKETSSNAPTSLRENRVDFPGVLDY